MFRKIPYNKILFLDIETVPQYESWEKVPPKMQELWEKKITKLLPEGVSVEDFYFERAGILAEFGKIICISCGLIKENQIRLKSFYGDDEKSILEDFADLLKSNYFYSEVFLCAHNGKEFDFPYLARRMLINQIELPETLRLYGKKPWEVKHLDTMDLWKFGDYKHFTSLDLLTYIFGIPSPKEDIDGSQVADVYYTYNDLEKIKNYCEKDVVAVAQLLRKLREEPLLEIHFE